MNYITFFSPPTFENWSWANPDTVGIGGSETSLIVMAEKLAARGHSVTVYAPIPRDTPTPHNGVHWLHLDQADFTRPGHWIISRAPEIADQFRMVHSGQTLWLICQDEDYQQRWAEGMERMPKFNRIVALCKAQADQFRVRYPSCAAKVFQSSNGLRRDLVESVLAEQAIQENGKWKTPGNHCDKCDNGCMMDYDENGRTIICPECGRHDYRFPLKRDPYRIIYASSPDRGLEPLLHIHQRLREYVPEATLHVCYGFDNINKNIAEWEVLQAEGRLPGGLVARMKWIKGLKEQIATSPGVVHHGRMPQRELYREIAQASLWVYPTNFKETSPISGDTVVSRVWGGNSDIERAAALLADDAQIKWWADKKSLVPVHSIDRTGALAASIATDVKCHRQDTEMVTMFAVGVDGKQYQLTLTPDHEVLLAESNAWSERKQTEELKRVMARQGPGTIIEMPAIMRYDTLPAVCFGPHDTRTYCPAGELQPGDRVRVIDKAGQPAAAVVFGVAPAPRADGYCMNVAPDHNFVANGIVVHNCITSMEMQALGAIPIVSPLWAVEENVQHGVHVPGNPLSSKLVQARFVGEAVPLLLEQERMEQIRRVMQPWAAETFDYERWVDQYEEWMLEDQR